MSRELLNEDLVELMKRAIQAVQAMPEQEYYQKVGAGFCHEHWQGQAALAHLCTLHLAAFSALGQHRILGWGCVRGMGQYVPILPCPACPALWLALLG